MTPILDSEVVARFIFSDGHFSTQKRRVKPNTFLPNADGETSVFRILDMDKPSIWAIGEDVAIKRNQTLYARADVLARGVRSVGLQVFPKEPPPKHGNILGWPESRDGKMELARLLANMSTLALPND